MTKNDLQTLFSLPERPETSILSVYLSVDQSRQANLNRAFETKLHDMLLPLRNSIQDEAEMLHFDRASRQVKEFVAGYKPHAHTLAVFADTASGFFWHREFSLTLPDVARWDRGVYSQPLVSAADQFDHYGVVLADRANLRVFAVFLGDIEECVHQDFGPARTRHIKTAGSDSLGSASQLQRKADEQVRSNLRQAVTMVDSFVQQRKLRRLLLAGTPEITAELQQLLPKRLSNLVMGAINLPIGMTAEGVLAAAQPVADDFERTSELRTVDEVITAAAKTAKAVMGLGPALDAINSNRAWQFIYPEGFSAPGFECSRCGALFPAHRLTCLYCVGDVQGVDNVIERAIEQAVRKGARVEAVTGEAAGSLESAGGLGVFLKTRVSGSAKRR